MDFEELKDESHNKNVRKNRATLVALFAIFFIPVIIAYSAYFTGWFNQATQNKGQLLVDDAVLDIEDFRFTRPDGSTFKGEEFETLYWWLMPIDTNSCNESCLEMNVFTLNQTYLGLGKEAKRLKPLLVLPEGSELKDKQFPTAFSQFSGKGVKALDKTRSGLQQDLPANYIYLVDPLGNIFMRYDLVKDREKAVEKSKDLRTDVLRLFKFSRLG